MTTMFLASLLLFLLFFLALSLSYLVKRKPLKGSCGGLSALGIEKVCDCPEPCDKRKKALAQAVARKKALRHKRIL